ncbi:MAG: hypothetical protein A2687_02240 [Candidatus Levybacteria bacterium RIFCSPHIGHO2_01_FULL_38_26]|nr:MAG: hypothetical protein A2687_02240 [Candidatus Levybacteria bacterium RIFCSPHIGHO2_01_FULL_38_26]
MDIALTLPGSFGGITPPPNVPEGSLFVEGVKILQLGVSVFLTIIILLSIGYILWGSIRYIIARGEREKIQSAREKITYAIVGLVVALLAFFVVAIVGDFFNVPLF